MICGNVLSEPDGVTKEDQLGLRHSVLTRGRTFEPRQTSLNRNVNFTLLRRRAEVRVGHTGSVLLAPLLAEREAHHRQQLLLLEHTNEVDPQRCIPGLHVAPHAASASRTPRRDRSCSSRGCETSLVPTSAVLPATPLRSTTPSACCATSSWRARQDPGGLAFLLLLALDRLGRVLVA